VCAITVTGRALSYDIETGERSEIRIDNPGQLDVHAMCPVPERDLIVGAPYINSQFWTIDMTSGKGTDRGRGMPGAGQINQIIWDAGRHRALMSAYTAAALVEYDPAKPAKWPQNPRVVASARSEEQMRPRALKFDRRYAWMATSPVYGKLGGALSRIDPESNEIKVFRNIVPDQTINTIALDPKRRRVYIASEIYADMNAAPPTQTTAQLVAFDMDKLTVIKRQVVREGAPKLAVSVVLNDGRVLVHENNQYFAWNVQDWTIMPLGALNTAAHVAADERGELWASCGGSLGRLNVGEKSIQFTPRISHPIAPIQIDQDTLYYAIGTTIYATPLEELRAK
jgi:hypothetical protein